MLTAPEVVFLFNALPRPYLLLSPDLVIEAVSEAYLVATLTRRERLLGQYLFDAFPDNPQTPEANGVFNLRASLLQVLATGQPHQMAQQHYDVPDPDRPGQFVERHWQPLNAPVLNAQGQVIQLIHSVLDITAEVQAQAQLRTSQAAERAARAEAEAGRQRFYDLLMQLPTHVAVHEGPDQVFTLVNPTYQRLAPGRDLLGQPIRTAWPELVSQGILDRLDQVYQTGEPFVATELPIRADFTRTGQLEQVYYNFFFQALRNAQGQIYGVLNFSYDVTASVRARQQLEQLNQELEARVAARTQELLASQAATERQRQRFEDLFQRAPAGICIFDGPNWVYEFINPGYQRLFPGRQLLGLPLLEALPEVAGQPLLDILHRVYDTGVPFEGKEVLVSLARTDESPTEDIYFDLTYQARFDEQGLIDGFVTYANDVTNQVLARQEREARQQQLHRLFQEAPAAICILTGPDLVYELVNPGYQALFPGRELLGRPILEALPEIADHAVYHTLRRVFDTGQTHEESSILIPIARPTDGVLEARYFQYIQQARRDEQGRIDGVLVFAYEVTEQVEARQQVQTLNEELAAINEELQATNEELNASNTQLVRTNVDLDNFIYTASHDLKAPITNLEGLLYLLRDELPAEVAAGPYVAPALARMLAAVERFQHTIDQLTEVAKLQQAHAPASTAVDLAAVIEDVRLDLAPLLRETNAELHVNVTAFPPIHFAEKNLRSVVYNLLSNALKYRHPARRPHVDLRGHLRPGYTILEVHDNGLGLAESQLPQLFGMFQRFHDHVEGTGIGLYMVKRMVENAGGRIEVHTQLGAGTTFYVYLPQSVVTT